MTSKVQTYRQYPRYKVNIISPLNENIRSNSDIITQSDVDLKPLQPKSKIKLWPTILWIGLGILLLSLIAIAVVVPIAVLANKDNATTTSTTSSTICPTTAITTTVTSSSLPFQCSNYTTITDPTRNPTYSATSSCDIGVIPSSPIWFRFTGSGGTLLASCPIDASGCGADAPGWYSGLYPSLAGDVKSGYVCYNAFDDLCYDINFILVTNCNGFYVYYLAEPPNCDYRYCTI